MYETMKGHLVHLAVGVDRLTKSVYNVRGKGTWGCGAEGARLLGMEEAAGSNPASSTKILDSYRCHAVKVAWHRPFGGI